MDADVEPDVDLESDVESDLESDADRWEARHRAAYGCGAWERARHQGGLMTAWYREQDPLFGAQASRRSAASDPGARVKWPWGSGPHTLGLLLWRAARDAGILVDEVLLADVLRHCDPASAPAAAGPMPDGARDGGIGVGAADAVAGARQVLLAHLTPGRPRAGSAGERPAATVGYRVREILATPDWEAGDWPAVIAQARQAMRRADDLRERGAWRPGAGERSLYGRLALDREPADGTGTPEGRIPDWLARATHLAGLADVLSTAAAALPDGEGGAPAPSAQVLAATARACAGLRPGSEEVRFLWAAEPRRPRDPADWESARVPDALRDRTEETRDLVRSLSAFLWALACA